MQFPIQDHYIHTSRHRKDTIRSKWALFCVCSYVYNDLEWETTYEQAPKKVSNRIFHKEERKRNPSPNPGFLILRTFEHLNSKT